MRSHYIGLLALLSFVSVTAAQEPVSFTLQAGRHDLKNVPVCVPLSLTKEQVRDTNALVVAGKETLAGQLITPAITTEHIKPAKNGLVRRDLHFILPELKADESVAVTFKPRTLQPLQLRWGGGDGKEFPELSYIDPETGKQRAILRYMNQGYDKSTPEKRDRTYKVFHHLYDPAGKRFVTNGGECDVPLGEKQKLLYPHHRGLMFAFNRISYGDKQQADTWHCGKGEHQLHVQFVHLNGAAGQVLGRHRTLIDWHGRDDALFAKEERELTVYNVPGGTLVEFAARLKTVNGPVKLDGDPQHAGFQFRAANEVAEKTAAQTYYLRPDGKDAPGKTRNLPEVKTHIDLPWNAMSFVLGGKRYTAVYMNHPRNPGESRWSERDYGRFGCYFAFDLSADRPLVVNYRLWLQDGEMTAEQATALSHAFVAPPTSK